MRREKAREEYRQLQAIRARFDRCKRLHAQLEDNADRVVRFVH